MSVGPISLWGAVILGQKLVEILAKLPKLGSALTKDVGPKSWTVPGEMGDAHSPPKPRWARDSYNRGRIGTPVCL